MVLTCRRLKKEQELFLPPPGPRFGSASVVHGPRICIFGGWNEEQALDDLIAIDMELPHETSRR